MMMMIYDDDDDDDDDCDHGFGIINDTKFRTRSDQKSSRKRNIPCYRSWRRKKMSRKIVCPKDRAWIEMSRRVEH